MLEKIGPQDFLSPRWGNDEVIWVGERAVAEERDKIFWVETPAAH